MSTHNICFCEIRNIITHTPSLSLPPPPPPPLYTHISGAMSLLRVNTVYDMTLIIQLLMDDILYQVISLFWD